ncbi:hypothetical protein GBF38_005407 [Nibea albiflora]|uniref:Uncharacterized protein n=1 Tax=Nibea albiflora TaxID=240163 RepID=A0ACB7EVY6_NIBAL|nr:hypothetical protein GBF38_005407 [Nibea albiflora]
MTTGAGDVENNELLLNANLNTEVTLVTHHLFHRYLAPPAQNVRDANPANLYPGNELTQTAADGIITSFPTFPGMSCLANLAVGLCLGSDKARHEVFETTSMPSEGVQRECKV